MTGSDWVLAIKILFILPALLASLGYCGLRHPHWEWRITGGLVLILALLIYPLVYNAPETAPIYQDSIDASKALRQPESRESLLQQREYLEARLWEIKESQK